MYGPDEIAVMLEDIEVAADAGAAGVVLGALTEIGTVDVEVSPKPPLVNECCLHS